MNATLLRTPLYEAHQRSGARLVPYAGYELPVQYQSVIAEVKAVRTNAGMFDVSHMARLRLTGAQTLDFLQRITTNDVSKLGDGHGQYSLLPNLEGGLVDDIIVYRVHQEEFRMVVNGANHEKDLAWINSQNSFGVKVEDLTERTAMIAVQGPAAAQKLAQLCGDPDRVQNNPFFGVLETAFAGVHCYAPRSGYTGEDGYELICNASDAAKLWDALLNEGVEPCGLASRDILRVEAGLPLYGHELSDHTNPIAAGLGWVISRDKSFNSKEDFDEARVNGCPMKLLGIKLDSKRVAEPDAAVMIDERNVGPVTSGVFSPTLNCGLALAYLESSIEIGTTCQVEVRGKLESGTVVSKRFYKRS